MDLAEAALPLELDEAVLAFSTFLAVPNLKEPESPVPLTWTTLFFSMALVILSRDDQMSLKFISLVIVMDLLWVIGSLILLIAARSAYTGPGSILISACALIVAIFALLQYKVFKW